MEENKLNQNTDQPTQISVESLNSEPPAQHSASDNVLPPAQHTAPKKAGKLKLILIILILLIVVGTGIAVYLMQRDKGQTNQTSLAVRQEIDVLRIGSQEGPASTYFPSEEIYGVYFSLNRQIYEGLVGFDDLRPAPLLAESWTNPDEKTWVFKLRPNVTFHTGKTLTAKDVKENLDALKDYEYWSLFVSTIESVEATGDLQVTIKTKEPDSLLLNRLASAFIMDLSKPDAAGNNGTGAFQADTSAKNDEKSTTLIAYDKYYGGRSSTRKVVYNIYEERELLLADVREGKLEMAEISAAAAKSDKETEGTNLQYVPFETAGIFGMFLNQARTNSPLGNAEVRKAVAQAVDRTSYLKELNNDNEPTSQIIPRSLPGYDANIKLPEFNKNESKETLTKAGFKDGVTLDYLYLKGIQEDAPILIKQLREAGFTINEKVFDEPTKEFRTVLGKGDFDLFSGGYASDLLDARDILGSILHSKEQSYRVLVDKKFDAILEQSDVEFDTAKRIELLKQANNYVADNNLWVPIRSADYAAYVANSLELPTDFTGGASSGVYFKNASFIVQP